MNTAYNPQVIEDIIESYLTGEEIVELKPMTIQEWYFEATGEIF